MKYNGNTKTTKITTDKDGNITSQQVNVNVDWTEQELINMIADIIGSEVYLRDVPYSMQDGDMEKDPDSVTDAAKAIVNMLKERGLI
jgi:hypothetical protein